MWLFAGVSLAICTPCFRAALEALFAELTIIFFNHLALVALSTVLAFVAALLLLHCTPSTSSSSLQQRQQQHATSVASKCEPLSAALPPSRSTHCSSVSANTRERRSDQPVRRSDSSRLHSATKRLSKAAVASNGVRSSPSDTLTLIASSILTTSVSLCPRSSSQRCSSQRRSSRQRCSHPRPLLLRSRRSHP